MLNSETKRSIDAARQVLVGQVPDPKGQVEQITAALLYKFMDALDKESVREGGKASFFVGDYKFLAWSELMSGTLDATERLNLYRKGVEGMSENQNLPDTFRGIFKGAFLSFNDPRTLRLFLTEVDGIQYNHSEDLGDAFEYLLSILGSQGDAGQFRTPRHIIDFIVEVISPKKNERILDPACGTAGFLISAQKHIYREGSSNGKSLGDKLTPGEKTKLAGNIVGYDISPDMVRLSLTNMYLHGLKQPQIREYDTLTSDTYWDEDFDVIFANPPFMTPKGGIKPHKRFSISASRSEVLFVDYIAEHLTLKGRAGIIVPEGIIFQSAKAYKSLRKNLVEDWGLWAVVSLPAGVFNPYSGVKTSILLIDKQFAKKTDEILFVKAENDGFDLGAQRRKIERDDLPDVLEVLKAWKEGEKQEKDLALWVKKEKISEGDDYNLTGDGYIEVEVYENQKWPMVELGQVAKIGAGNSAPQGKEFFKDGRHPFCRTSDVGKVHISDNFRDMKDFLNDEGIKGLKLYKKDTILFPKSGASTFLNHRVILAIDSYVSSHLATIYADKDKILPKFLFRLLLLIDAKTLTGNQNYPSLKLSEISKIKLPLPSLEIQEEIVEQIEIKQNAINHAKEIIKNLERERCYFGQDLGKLEDVEKVELGQVAKIGAGNSAPQGKEFFKGGRHPFCRTSDVGKVHISDNFRDMKDFLNDEGIKGLKLHKKDTILFPKSGASTFLNHRVMLAIDSYVSSHLATLYADKDKILPKFLFRLLLLIDAKTLTINQNYPSLKLSGISKIKLPLPPLEVQKQLITEVEKEEEIMATNRRLIELMENKIESVLRDI